MRDYLVRNYEAQPLLNRISVLWASGTIPGLLTAEQRRSLLADIQSHQQADGGWTTSNLGPWKRKDGTPLDAASDGYATGLTLYALLQAGVPETKDEIQRGRAWLIANQDADGHWNATSLNKNRPSATEPAKFMSDAATGYAVLALSALPQCKNISTAAEPVCPQRARVR